MNILGAAGSGRLAGALLFAPHMRQGAPGSYYCFVLVSAI